MMTSPHPGASSNPRISTPVLHEARKAVKCPHCGHTLFDGLVIKSRVVRLTPRGAEAKCPCKAWVAMPMRYDASPF